jgi:hypothetical protein
MYYQNIHIFTADYHDPFEWDPLAKLTSYAELYGVSAKKHQTVASHWQTWSHNVDLSQISTFIIH